MAKAKNKTKKKPAYNQSESAYILKLVLFMVLGSLWIKITTEDSSQWPIPIGFIIGVFFAMHEHFKIDRKIEYALLLVAMFIGFWLPIGLFISL
jgi:uncharacterized transporter YbjL